MEEIKTPYKQLEFELKSKSLLKLKEEFKHIFKDKYMLNRVQNSIELRFQKTKLIPTGYFFYLSYPDSVNDKFPVILPIENNKGICTCINLNYLSFIEKRKFLDLYYSLFSKSLVQNQKLLESDTLNPSIKFSFENNYEGIKYIVDKLSTKKETLKSIRKYNINKVNKLKLYSVEDLKYLLIYDLLEFSK